MKATFVKESLNENLGQGLFGVLEIDPDYTQVEFYGDEASARDGFNGIEGGVLFSLNGPGTVYAGGDVDGSGGVTIIEDKYPEW